jgi:hypothetical protein
MKDGRPGARSSRPGPSGRAALELLACCPRIPTDVVGILLGLRHTSSAAQLLTRLQNADLIRAEVAKPGPLLGIRSIRLWSLSAPGRTIVLDRASGPLPEDQVRLPYGGPPRSRDPHRLPDVPMLIAAYRLLGAVVGSLHQGFQLVAWEHPWVRRVRPPGQTRFRQARLPAATVLLLPDGETGRADGWLQLLLLPDLGTAPVARFRPLLRTLLQLRQEWWAAGNQDEPLLVVATRGPAGDDSRTAAWHSLVQHSTRGSGEPPLRTLVIVAPDVTGGIGADDKTSRRVAKIDHVLSLVARHPLLTQRQLAILVGTARSRIVRLQAELVERGWIRPIRHEQLPHVAHGLAIEDLQHLGLVELTPAGRREAVRRLLVTGLVAARYHGLVGGRVGMRCFLRHPAHTVGANAFFVALVDSARTVRRRGGDDELEEWRSAAACARGRFRPDGYGCYRRAGSRFGFFLEYDRATERPRDYAAKLAAYYRYRDSGDYRREYQSFPTMLLVTISEVAEARFARQAYLAQQRHGSTPLRMFLTTTGRITAHPEGVLGPIWRSAAAPWAVEPARVCWLPRLRLTSPLDARFRLARHSAAEGPVGTGVTSPPPGRNPTCTINASGSPG